MHGTGTASLDRALRQLGVSPVVDRSRVRSAGLVEALVERGDPEPALRYARPYRAFTGSPWNMWDLYRHLDRRYPGSRFVLTERDAEEWWRWLRATAGATGPDTLESHRLHLRAATSSQRDMVESFLRRNREIREFFGDRDDFLVLDVARQEGWEPLCRLLGDLPAPELPFPTAPGRRSREGRPATPPRPPRPAVAPRPLGIERCVRCGAELRREHPQERPWVARLPRWSKDLYRSLQRRAFAPPRDPASARRRAARLRRDHPGLRIDDLAVVTCVFNPCGYRSRLDNYRTFRRNLERSGVGCLTVELAVADDPHLLAAAPGEVLQVRSSAALWQKERLLNLGIREMLSRGYRKIVWLDADVVFEDAVDWPWHVAAALDRNRLCQVFDAVLVEEEGKRPLPGVSAVRYAHDHDLWFHQERRLPSWRWPFGYPLGYAGYGWAARADLLERVELYDRAVVGGGDELMLAASVDRSDGWEARAGHLLRSALRRCARCGHRNAAPGYLADYLTWARRWHEQVGGRCGWADLTARSLYHGDRLHRHYSLRRDILLRHEFDPTSDLALDGDGCWRWASAKTRLHLEVQNYFFERREDS